MKSVSSFAMSAMLALTLMAGNSEAKPVAAAVSPIPQLVQKNGKFALMVDGAPFLILGGQANNSSNYPAALDTVDHVSR